MSLPTVFLSHKHLIHLDPKLEIIRMKFYNCSTQYKSKNVFGKYKQLASEKGVPVICYYGVSHHGKGLVDPMSGFESKGPSRKAFFTQDSHYGGASHYLLMITRSTILSVSPRKSIIN